MKDITIQPIVGLDVSGKLILQAPGEATTLRLRDKDKSNLLKTLQIIATVPNGKELLKTLLPKLNSKEIEIRQITEDVRLRSSTKPGYAPLAAFEFDGKSKIIYVDFNASAGALAPVFFHEAFHATDEDFLGSFSKMRELEAKAPSRWAGMTEIARLFRQEGVSFPLAEYVRQWRDRMEARRVFTAFRDTRTYKAELRAHRAMAALISQLEMAHPGYEAFLEDRAERGDFAFPQRSRAAIAIKHGLNIPAVLESLGGKACSRLFSSLAAREALRMAR